MLFLWCSVLQTWKIKNLRHRVMTWTSIWSEPVQNVRKQKFSYANYFCICHFPAFISFSFLSPLPPQENYHKVFWRQLIWKGSQGHSTQKPTLMRFPDRFLPNLGHLHTGNFTGIQTGITWIQNLHHENWDRTWMYWPSTAFDQTLSARILWLYLKKKKKIR